MVWKWHQKMPVTWYTFKWHPTCQTPCQDYPVLQDSKVRLKGHNESWQCSVCLNGLKLSGPIQNTFLSTLKTILMVSGTILSSKTPGSDFEDIGSLDGLFAIQSWWNLQYWFRIHFLANLYQFQWSQEPSVLQDSRIRLWGHRDFLPSIDNILIYCSSDQKSKLKSRSQKTKVHSVSVRNS